MSRLFHLQLFLLLVLNVHDAAKNKMAKTDFAVDQFLSTTMLECLFSKVNGEYYYCCDACMLLWDLMQICAPCILRLRYVLIKAMHISKATCISSCRNHYEHLKN